MTFIPPTGAGGDGIIQLSNALTVDTALNSDATTFVTLASTTHTPTSNGYISAFGVVSARKDGWGSIYLQVRYSTDGGNNWTTYGTAIQSNRNGFWVCPMILKTWATVANSTYLIQLQGVADTTGAFVNPATDASQGAYLTTWSYQ